MGATNDILLIGDVRGELRARLQADGHRPLLIGSLSERLAQPAPPEVDLVVSMAPTDAAEEARLSEVLRGPRNPPLILLVATERFEDARAGLRLGAADVLPPDVGVEVLSEAVTRALQRKQVLAEELEAQSIYAGVFAGVEPEQLPRAIVDAACKLLRADDASLMLLGADDRLHLAYSRGLSVALQQGVSIALGERVAGRIAQSGKAAIIGGAAEVDPRFSGVTAFRDLRSSIVFPLKDGDRLIGVLNLNRQGGSSPFVPADLGRTQVFSTQVVMALENVRMLRHVAAGEGMAAVGRIATAVAHEINNPASWVISSLNFLDQELDKPKSSRAELKSALADAKLGMQRIRDIVKDFRMLTEGEGQRSGFDLSEVIRSASRVAGAVLHGAAVTLELTPDLQVVGNRSSLAQAFVNLILNAGAEASPGHHIRIRSYREGGSVMMSVSDTGRILTSAQLATLFDPIFGARGPRAAGLGLSISRDTVREHGGELSVRSEKGEGTVLTVKLPESEGSAPALAI